MKESPILFSTPMVKAILNGNKTQTRRVIKDQSLITKIPATLTMEHSPFGCPDDLLWVRETWNLFLNDKGPEGYTRLINFPANNVCIDVPEEHWEWWDLKEERGYLNRPSIHMPKWMSRIWLKVKDIRVERLQDISEEDAKKEGIEYEHHYDGTPEFGHDMGLWYKDYIKKGVSHHSPIKSFKSLWDSINGEPRKDGKDISWKANPWVWAVEFERIEKWQIEQKR